MITSLIVRKKENKKRLKAKVNLLNMGQLLIAVCLMAIALVECGGHDRVLLRDVEVITLYDNKMTTGRRNSPINQLKCVGGSAGCYSFKPQVVQCYNRGFDGTDVQWECKADLDSSVKFGRIEVLCEGFDYPDDPYILKGSCGLEYHLENSGKGKSTNSYGTKSEESSWSGPIIFILVILAIWFFFTTCSGNSGRNPSGPGGYGGGGPDDPHMPDSRGPPPPYGWTPGSNDNSGYPHYSKPSTSAGASSGPGFWTGAGVGGMLGYLFGNANRPYAQNGAYNRPYGGGGAWGFGSNTPSTSWNSGGSSSGSTASSSGFGGTRRR